MLKKLSLLLGLLLILATANAQSPTLGVGLEALTMSKGTIDVQALTEIIMEKQAQLKNEALKRFMLKMFPETNYTTKFYIQHCLQILLNEKNPQVIEKEIYELTTNYALALGIAKVYPSISNKPNIDAVFREYLKKDVFSPSKMLAAYKLEKFNLQVEGSAEKRLEKINKDIKALVSSILPEEVYRAKRKSPKFEIHFEDSLRNSNFKKLESLENLRIREEKKVLKQKFKDQLLTSKPTPQPGKEVLPVGLWVDITSAALSDVKLLKAKGFFRKTVDFRSDEFYRKLKVSTLPEDIALLTEIDTSIGDVNRLVEQYIKYHSTIQEFYSAITEKNAGNDIKASIVKNLQSTIKDMGQNNLVKLLDSDVFLKFKSVKSFLSTLDTNNAIGRKVDNVMQAIRMLPDLNKEYLDSKRDYNALVSNYSRLQKKYLQYLPTLPEKIEDAKPLEINGMVLPDTVGNALKDSLAVINVLIARYSTVKTLPEAKKTHYEGLCALTTLNLDTLGIDKKLLENFIANKDVKIPDFKDIIRDLIGKKQLAEKANEAAIDTFSENKDFYNALLTKISGELLTSNSLPANLLKEENKDFFKDYSALLADNYKYVNKLIAAQKIGVEDIRYIENHIIPEYIRLATALSFPPDSINVFIRNYSILSKMLKVSAISNLPEKFIYDPALQDVLKFVSNLSNLDKAETYQDMLGLFEHANGTLVEALEEGEFKKTYILFSNAIKKYTLVNSEKQSVEIDVVSFLNELQNFYGHNNHSIFGLYMTLGLNQNFFFRKVSVPGEIDEIKNIGFASEKLGLKLRFNKIKNLNGLENSVLSDVNLNTNAPFINEWYGIVYGSGLLYSLANTSTNKNFDYPHAGIGTGIRFYNALDLNFVVGIPFIKNQSPFRNTFVGIGLDIPLGEYLEKIGNKK